MVSTWATMRMRSPSSSRISIRRSKIASQFWLRARLSSVMKKLWTPCARLARTMRSTSSALRQRDLRPWTLMIVQKLHRNGQPRPASKLVRTPIVRRTTLERKERHRRAFEAPADRS